MNLVLNTTTGRNVTSRVCHTQHGTRAVLRVRVFVNGGGLVCSARNVETPGSVKIAM